MSKHLIITIPAEQKHLSRQIAQGVEEYADVSQAPSYTDLETIKMAANWAIYWCRMMYRCSC